MEVHHHAHLAPGETHTARKKWTHYFWEFLMLFLAVTLGFFVENQREHFIEHRREKQYMLSLIKDLEQDRTNIATTIELKQISIRHSDSLIKLLSRGDFSDYTALIYYYGRYGTIKAFFYPTNATLQQLKNAGGFRLIRNREVVDSVQDYDNLYQQISEHGRIEVEEEENFKEVAPRIFDIRIFEEMVDKDGNINMPNGNPQLIGADKIDINNLLIQAHYAKRSKIGQISRMRRLEQRAQNLIALVKKEYQIKS